MSKLDVHFVTGFKFEDRAVGTVLVWMFSNIQDDVLKWKHIQHMIRILHFIDLKSGQFSTRPITYLYPYGGNNSYAHNFWTQSDRRMKWVPKCLSCGPE